MTPPDPFLASASSLPICLNLGPKALLAPALVDTSHSCSLAREPPAARVRGESGENLTVKTLPCARMEGFGGVHISPGPR
jgi:hypothetical protein